MDFQTVGVDYSRSSKVESVNVSNENACVDKSVITMERFLFGSRIVVAVSLGFLSLVMARLPKRSKTIVRHRGLDLREIELGKKPR